jgi:hypothetical protein
VKAIERYVCANSRRRGRGRRIWRLGTYHAARVDGRCKRRSGIAAFDADNSSAHRGARCLTRLQLRADEPIPIHHPTSIKYRTPKCIESVDRSCSSIIIKAEAAVHRLVAHEQNPKNIAHAVVGEPLSHPNKEESGEPVRLFQSLAAAQTSVRGTPHVSGADTIEITHPTAQIPPTGHQLADSIFWQCNWSRKFSKGAPTRLTPVEKPCSVSQTLVGTIRESIPIAEPCPPH